MYLRDKNGLIIREIIIDGRPHLWINSSHKYCEVVDPAELPRGMPCQVKTVSGYVPKGKAAKEYSEKRKLWKYHLHIDKDRAEGPQGRHKIYFYREDQMI